jgi:hypothetical protein
MKPSSSAGLLLSLALLLFEDAAQDFAGRIAWDGIDKLDFAHVFVAGKFAVASCE